ncbi:energy-coupling factor transporter transmembrane component T family protein [Consotaella aegiceratis]|uniref:energy-coupling factor transporter transmembrane component T family protein n=1 Tax=Consotaella aegiceratis TaxID=3097961 RepID=UPI002F405FCF
MIAAPRPGAASHSVVHRLPLGWKLLAVAVAGTGLMLVDDWRIMAAALAVVCLFYGLAGLTWRDGLRQLRPLAWVLAVLFVVQTLLQSWALGVLVVLRIAVLVLLAALVTLTTRSDALIAAIEKALAPFARLGVNPAKVGLAFSLALRFIPVIGEQARQIREAQQARGLGSRPLAMVLPLIVRTLKTASDVADAIEARSAGDEGDGVTEHASRSPDPGSRSLSCSDPKPRPATSSISRFSLR